VWRGRRFGRTDFSGSRLLARQEIRLVAPFKVEPPVDDARSVYVTDDTLAPQVFASIRAGPMRLSSRPAHLSGTLSVVAPPADVSFDVFARVGSTMYPVGSVMVAQGKSHTVALGCPYSGPRLIATVDLVLRPNAISTLRTVELLKPWGKEVELNKLRVYVDPP
jgi:hypothetical protein